VSIHQNPDTSLTEGMKVEPNGTFVAHTSVTGLASATGIGASVAAAKTAGATQAIVQALTAAVSYRLDGTAPTSTVGVQLAVGQSVTLNMTDAAAALFISATGALFVTYTM
jgi:hypothetical protein